MLFLLQDAVSSLPDQLVANVFADIASKVPMKVSLNACLTLCRNAGVKLHC